MADEKFGSLDKRNDNWNGIVGMVQKNQIDTSILDLAITKERSSFVSFTTPFRSYRIKLFMKKPQSQRSWDTFLKVWKLNYWFVMTSSFLCCIICIFLSNCLMPECYLIHIMYCFMMLLVCFVELLKTSNELLLYLKLLV